MIVLSVPRIVFSLVVIMFTGLTLSACQAVLGLNDYDVNVAPPMKAAQTTEASCQTHADCSNAPTSQGGANATYCTSAGRCEALDSEDCSRIAGPEREPNAVLIATMFATSGVDSAVELARQHAVQIAVDEINDNGGIPAKDSERSRKFLLVACDAAADRVRATAHLARLQARAILGLSDAEQLFETLRSQLLAANILTLSTALASDGINSLLDGDLAWLMSPTVEQRAPAVDAALRALEQHLQTERTEPLKLAIVIRNDSASRATLSALRMHELDGLEVGMPEQSSDRLRVDRFPEAVADQQALLAAYRAFAPDIVVIVGGVDVLTGFLAPLERWYESDAARLRPHYLLTEEAKGPALIALARELPSLLERVHGVGATVPERSRYASEQFLSRYVARFSDSGLGTAPRVAAAYDAVYALAYALAAVESGHEVGGRLAQALHALEAPEQAADATYEVGPESLAAGLRAASSGEGLALFGAAGELHWDIYGSLATAALEAWCLEAASGGLRYGNAPWLFDVAAGSFSVRSGSCDSWLEPTGNGRGKDPKAESIKTVEVTMSTSSAGHAGQDSAPSVDMSMGMGAAGVGGGAGGSAAAMMPPQVEAPPSSTNSAMRCGQLSCQRDKEQCCVAMPSPLTADLSCRSRSAPAQPAAGSGGSQSCVFSAQCASDADCNQGNVCCADAKQARCVAAGMCSAEVGRRLACRSAQECPVAQQCCLYADSSAMSFAFSACAPSCNLTDGSLRLCVSDAGCADDPTSTSCSPSALLPFVNVCFPTPRPPL